MYQDPMGRKRNKRPLSVSTTSDNVRSIGEGEDRMRNCALGWMTTSCIRWRREEVGSKIRAQAESMSVSVSASLKACTMKVSI